jgi:hypothetical protein
VYCCLPLSSRWLTFIKQIWYIHGRSLHTLHLSETLGSNGTRKFSTLFTNLYEFRNKTLPIPQLGCLLTRSRNSHNNKHAVAGYATKIARFRKDPMVYEQEYLLYENLNFNGLVAVMGKYLISAHWYSTICVLQTWVLGFRQHEDLMDGNWLSDTSTCWNDWQYEPRIWRNKFVQYKNKETRSR